MFQKWTAVRHEACRREAREGGNFGRRFIGTLLRNSGLFGIFYQNCYQVATKTGLSYHKFQQGIRFPLVAGPIRFCLDTL